jgi:hypothetical protein
MMTVALTIIAALAGVVMLSFAFATVIGSLIGRAHEPAATRVAQSDHGHGECWDDRLCMRPVDPTKLVTVERDDRFTGMTAN